MAGEFEIYSAKVDFTVKEQEPGFNIIIKIAFFIIVALVRETRTKIEAFGLVVKAYDRLRYGLINVAATKAP
jgi:hypothetical protein